MAEGQVSIRLLGTGEEHVLERCAGNVFDHPINPSSTKAFLADPRHHLTVAVDGDTVVGFASAVHYHHPDKASPELWINEVAVAPTHQGRGLAKRLLQALLAGGRSLGCREAWVLTERANVSAMGLYRSLRGVEAPVDQVLFTFFLDDEPQER